MKVFIADDSPIVREGLWEHLTSENDVEVVGAASNAEETARLIPQVKPDIVILDIHMLEGDGVQALERMMEEQAGLVVMLTNFPRPQYRERRLDLGSQDFLDESRGFERMSNVIQSFQRH